MLTGDEIVRWVGGLVGPVSPFGPQYEPYGPGVDEDVDRSRQDTGSGWDQGYSMERENPDASSTPLKALASPPGVPIAYDHVALYLERNQGHDAEQVAPLLRGEILRDRFGSYVDLIEWCPEPGFINGYGFTAPNRQDVLPDIAKMLLNEQYSYEVIDGKMLMDEAIRRTRKAMWGR